MSGTRDKEGAVVAELIWSLFLRVLGGTIDRVALEQEATASGLRAAWKEMEDLVE